MLAESLKFPLHSKKLQVYLQVQKTASRVLHLGNLDLVDWQGLVLVGGVKLGLALAKRASISRHNSPSGYTGAIQVTLLEGSALLRGHDDLAPEPVAPPQDAHLLNGHSLGLRQEAQGVHSHAEHPEGEEDVCAILQAAQTTLDDQE